MPKKRFNRPHGHYCKISGKGHAAHICKSCSKLSAAEKDEAMTRNCLVDFSMGRLRANNKKWLENRIYNRSSVVASIAREVNKMHFPYSDKFKCILLKMKRGQNQKWILVCLLLVG